RVWRLQPQRRHVLSSGGELDRQGGSRRAPVDSQAKGFCPEQGAGGRDRVGQIVLLEEAVRHELPLAVAVAAQVWQQDVVAAVQGAQRLRAPLGGVAPLAVEEEDQRPAGAEVSGGRPPDPPRAERRREDRGELDRIQRGAPVAQLVDPRAARDERGEELLAPFAWGNQALGGDQSPGELPSD